MIKASLNDRHLVASILSQAYDTNDTINETVNEPAEKRAQNNAMQETKRRRKIYKLMSWGFDLCYDFGNVFLSENRKAALLILYPDKKRITWRSLVNELKLLHIIGLWNLPGVLQREIAYNRLLPKEGIIKGMFLGTIPDAQNKGTGTEMLNGFIDLSEATQRPIYIEARVKENEERYKKIGFETFHILKLGNRVWPCMKREIIKTEIALC